MNKYNKFYEQLREIAYENWLIPLDEYDMNYISEDMKKAEFVYNENIIRFLSNVDSNGNILLYNVEFVGKYE